MALKNKDGTIYKLSSPNPVMKKQEIWSSFTLHNMKWKTERYKDLMELKPATSDFKIREDFVSELINTKPPEVIAPVQPKVLETKVEPKREVIKETQVYEAKKEAIKIQEPQINFDLDIDLEAEKVFIHCLPAVIKMKHDKLYDEVYKTIQYGQPTSFEGIILVQGDINMTVWTDVIQIGEGSVLYPKTNFKRWWKVDDKTAKARGWLLTCSPSDYMPSFDFK